MTISCTVSSILIMRFVIKVRLHLSLQMIKTVVASICLQYSYSSYRVPCICMHSLKMCDTVAASCALHGWHILAITNHYTTNRLLQRLFPQLAAVVQLLLLGVLQSLTAVLLKTAANCLQRFLYRTAAK
jgi:uncharacterized membrane protein